MKLVAISEYLINPDAVDYVAPAIETSDTGCTIFFRSGKFIAVAIPAAQAVSLLTTPTS